MYLKNRTVLLDNGTEQGGGGEGATVTPPVSSAPTNIQAEAFKGSPAAPVSTKASPAIPDHVKGKTFEMDDDGVIDLPGNEDTHIEGQNLSKESKSQKTPQAVPELDEEEENQLDEKVGETTKAPEKPKFKAGLPEKPVVKPQQQQQAVARDYSIFPEEFREHLKKTSNEAFAFIESKYKELQAKEQELSQIKPEYEAIQKNGFPKNWTEHPDAWRLHPDAQQALGQVQRIEFEESHWAKQLELIEAGKQYRTIKGYDRNGNAVYSNPIEPDAEALKFAIANGAQLASMKQQTYLGINRFAQTFQEQLKGQQQAIENLIAEQWPWWKDEKHEAQKWVKEFEEILPPVVPMQTMKKVAALMYSSYQRALELLHEKKQEEAKQGVVKETVQAVEPRTAAPTPSTQVKKNGAGQRFKNVPAQFDLAGLE